MRMKGYPRNKSLQGEDSQHFSVGRVFEIIDIMSLMSHGITPRKAFSARMLHETTSHTFVAAPCQWTCTDLSMLQRKDLMSERSCKVDNVR